MADDATTLNYVDDATTVTVSDDSTVVESAAAGAPGVGVPSGGTTGQALVKNSNADYDTHWSTPSTVAALDDLTDVTAPTPANGDGLVWNGTAWVNVDVATQAELNAHTGATGTAVHGLGTASTHAASDFDAAGTASSAVASHVAAVDPHGDRAYAAGLVDDLSGVTDAATARTNLGLGGAATKNVGTTAGTVAAGDDSRLSDSRTPTGSAGGDLTGTYPNPTIGTGAVTSAKIADGTIVDADISGSAAIDQAKLAAKTINAQTTDYTLVLTDAAKTVTVTKATAVTLTVPTNASVAFSTGAEITVVNLGAGVLTIAGAGGVTVNGDLSLAQYSAVRLFKTATDTWTVERTGIPRTLLTAKGSMAVASAANTPGELTVGSNGKILIADSAQATGLGYSTIDLDAGSHKLTNVADPGSAQDVATKNYVDTGFITSSGGGKEVVQAHGNTGSTETIDLANGNVHTMAQDQSCTYTFTNPTNGVACSFLLIFTSVTGTATWPASVKWPDGVAPTLSGVSLLSFVTVDGGTTWRGALIGKAFA